MSQGRRFVADAMLGKLARWLRLLGHDVLYDRTWEDQELLEIAEREGRVLLTADRALMQQRRAEKFWVAPGDWRAQLRAVVQRFGLRADQAFTRCPECNAVLEPLDRGAAQPLVPPRVWRLHAGFARCRGCNRVFWAGSHFSRARTELKRILHEVKGAC